MGVCFRSRKYTVFRFGEMPASGGTGAHQGGHKKEKILNNMKFLEKAVLTGAGIGGYFYEGARELSKNGHVDFRVRDSDVNITASAWTLTVTVENAAKKLRSRHKISAYNAEGGTRTPTGIRPLRPERSASTNSTTSAFPEDEQ